MVDHSVRQRIYVAVSSLVDARPIRDRLETAALELRPIEAGAFPPGPQRELFEQILADLTKVWGSESEGHVRATLGNMDEEAAVRVARSIARLLYLIHDDEEVT
jgi:hypothetical protein